MLVGLVVGGTLGRAVMRLVFLAKQDALGFQTSMGAIVGEFTAGGTGFVYFFGALSGLLLGLAYAVGRTFLPSGTRMRTAVFTLGTTAFMLGQIVRGNREDFTFLPVTVSLLLVAGAVALTAAPVPVLVERLAPDRERDPGPVRQGLVAIALTGFSLFAITGLLIAYDV
jgi:hypothetical protein